MCKIDYPWKNVTLAKVSTSAKVAPAKISQKHLPNRIRKLCLGIFAFTILLLQCIVAIYHPYGCSKLLAHDNLITYKRLKPSYNFDIRSFPANLLLCTNISTNKNHLQGFVLS